MMTTMKQKGVQRNDDDDVRVKQQVTYDDYNETKRGLEK